LYWKDGQDDDGRNTKLLDVWGSRLYDGKSHPEKWQLEFGPTLDTVTAKSTSARVLEH
jgi:hypothetical protein